MPSSFDLILKNGKCFIDGQLKTTDIGISNGIIKSIGKIEKTSNEKIIEANNLVVLPGIIDTQGYEANILLGAKKLISSGTPIVIEFWPYGLKLNNSWDKLQDILKNFDYYYDLSEELIQKIKINSESIKNLFSNWEEEEVNKHSLYKDLLLI